jgi:hypothetical protein
MRPSLFLEGIAMARTTKAAGRTDRWIHKPILLLITGVIVVGCMHAAGPAYAAETGIRGTAVITPARPGPERLGQNNEAPLRATFTVYQADKKVADFKTDEKGLFEVSLPAGTYTIVPSKGTPVPTPERQKTQVTVPDDGFATVTIRIDSGML